MADFMGIYKRRVFSREYRQTAQTSFAASYTQNPKLLKIQYVKTPRPRLRIRKNRNYYFLYIIARCNFFFHKYHLFNTRIKHLTYIATILVSIKKNPGEKQLHYNLMQLFPQDSPEKCNPIPDYLQHLLIASQQLVSVCSDMH